MSGKASSAKGKNQKKSGPRYKNKRAWVVEPNSTKAQIAQETQHTGLCKPCYDRIQWRKQYGKYKPLSAPAKCSKCLGRRITLAYHDVCTECAQKFGICEGCQKPREIFDTGEDTVAENELQQNIDTIVSTFSERERRTFMRKQEKILEDGGTIQDVYKFLGKAVKQGMASASVDEVIERSGELDLSDGEEAKDKESIESDDEQNVRQVD
eukprot:Clim_evm68s207 gene=Clim_evmTU68s207